MRSTRLDHVCCVGRGGRVAPVPRNLEYTAALCAVHAVGAVQVVQQCRGLLERTVTGLFRAAELCAPYLDGRYNVDAAEVLEGDATATVEAALEPREEDGPGESLGPEVTLLIAGAPVTLFVLCCVGSYGVDPDGQHHVTTTAWCVDHVRVRQGSLQDLPYRTLIFCTQVRRGGMQGAGAR